MLSAACIVCGHDAPGSALLCLACHRRTLALLHPRNVPPWITGGLAVHAAAEYAAPFSRLVVLAKSQSGTRPLPDLLETIDRLIVHWVPEFQGKSPSRTIDAVAAVPSHPVRRWTGTRLSRYLARAWAAHLRVPDLSSRLSARLSLRSGWALRRQKDRSARERVDSRSRFTIDRRPGTGRVLLIDDICTTGASLIACRELLLARGFTCEKAWVLARTPLRRSVRESVGESVVGIRPDVPSE